MAARDPVTTKRTFRVAELSEILGVPRATVYRWIAEGSLPAFMWAASS